MDELDRYVAQLPDHREPIPTSGLSAQRQAALTALWRYCIDCNGHKHPRWFPTPEAPRCTDCTDARQPTPNAKRTPEERHARAVAKQCVKYGLTLEDYLRMEAEQHGCCAICDKRQRNDRALFIDHDHTTGRVRGLLCSRCNTTLGRFRDDTRFLKRCLVYLTDPPANGLGIVGYGKVYDEGA